MFAVPPLADAWQQWLVLALLLGGSASLGSLVIRRLPGVSIGGLERATLAVAIGFGLVAYLTLLAGTTAFLGRGYFALLVILLAVLSVAEILRLDAAGIARHLASRRIAPFEATCAIFVAAALFIAAAAAMAPPVLYDIAVYHYGVPSLYLLEGRIGFVPANCLASYPFTLEMLYTVGLALGGHTTANLINWALGMCAGLTVYATANRHFGRRAAFAGWAAFATSAAAIELTSTATNDIGVTFFFLPCIAALMRWHETRNRGWILAAALCAGFAMGSKYTAIALCVGSTVPVLLFIAFRSEDRSAAFKDLFIFLAASFAVFSPWAIKNYLHTGNPFYPFFSEIFGGLSLDPDRFALVLAEGKSISLRNFDWARWLLTPVSMWTDYPQGQFATDFSLFVAIAGAAAYGLPGKPSALKFLLAVTAAYFVLWSLSTRMIRFFFPGAAMMAIITGCLFARLEASGKASKVLLHLAFFAFAIQGTSSVALENPLTRDQFRTGIGHLSAERFMRTYYPLMPAAEFVRRSLPSDARLLFVGEARSYYFERKFVAPSAQDPHPIEHLVRNAKDETEVAMMLRQQGFTHLIHSPREMARLAEKYIAFAWTSDERSRFEDFLANHTVLLHADDAAEVRSISSPPAL